jgi:cell division protein FtsB
MNYIKTKSTNIFLIIILAEPCLFTCWYFQSAHYQELQELNQELQQEIELLHKTQQEIAALKQEIDDFQQYPYYREKIAREHLQLAHPTEELYRNPS